MLNYAGQILKSYELKELIDAGGFGAVYRANQAVVDREVAIKIIWPQFASRPNFIRRFEAEAQLVAGLEHPYIVPLYDYWRDPEGAYIVMRWLRGGHLRKLIAQGAMQIEDVARLFEQIAAALIFAHRYGVVHRDLKPENILLDEAGNAYLADFGIAQILSSSRSEDDEMASMGSPAYAAPEQMSGTQTTQQTDQYSLGIILYELLTGQHPFPDLAELTLTEMTAKRISEPLPPLSMVRPDLPVSVGQLIQRSTALNPNDRYADIGAMLRAFHDAISPLLRATNTGTIATATMPILRTQQLMAVVLDLPNPYKGLRTFQEADAGNFFGRQALIERLANRMSEQDTYTRFLAVVGPSGSGKSSVVKAGLIPALRSGVLPNSQRWFYVEMLPGTQPFKELEAALTSVAIQPPYNLAMRLMRDSDGLVNAVQQILPPDETTELFLLIDQFEEIFTQSTDEALTNRFLESLHAAVIHPNSRIRIVVTLRADFYDRPLLRPILGEMMRQRTEVIIPLNASELAEAIVEPARRLGVELESGLAGLIVAEVVDQPGALPLLQYLMSELFDRRQGALMTLEAYHSVGGVRGALAKRAEEIYEQFDPAQRIGMRQLLLRLITLGEGSEDVRRRALLSEVNTLGRDVSVIRGVIDLLGKSRLVTFDQDPETRSPTIEVTHEALIREWHRLREWLDTGRSDVRNQRTLAALALEWVNAGKDSSYVLRDARLRQFEAWLSETTLDLTNIENDFLHASLNEQKNRQTQELQRVVNEQKLEAQSRNRLRGLVGVMAIALIAGFALAAYALNESRRAQVESAVSQSLAQASGARRALTEGDTDLAILLAIEANSGANASPQALRTLTEVAFAPGTRDILTGHASFVTSVDFNPDATLLASASRDGTVRIWSQQNSSLIYELQGHRGDVQTVSFSPDGRYVASGGLDFLAILWDVQTGERIRTFTQHTGSIITLAFSPDGRYLTTGSRDESIIIWDVGTGEVIRTLSGLAASVQVVAYSPDGQIIAGGSGDGKIILWDALTGNQLRALSGHTTSVNDLEFTSDGLSLVSASADGSIMIWDVADGTINATIAGLSDVPFAFALFPDNQQALVGLRNGNLALLNLETGRESDVLRGHSGEIYGVAMSDDGRFGATGSADSTIRLWNILNPAEVARFSDHRARITGVEFLTGGSTLLTTSIDGTLRLRNIATQIETRVIDLGLPIRSLSVSSNGRLAYAGTRDGNVEMVDLATSAIIQTVPLYESDVVALTISTDGKMAAVGSQDGVPVLWDVETGAVTQRLAQYTDAVFNLDFNQDGSLLLFGGQENDAILWDVPGNTEKRHLTGHTDVVWSVAFSPDGTRAATGARNGEVFVWDVATGVELVRLNGHINSVWNIGYSADGKSIVTAGADGNVIWWNSETGEQMEAFRTATSPALKIAFQPNGNLIASGAERGSVQLWRLYNAQELVQWASDNRYLRDLTCPERNLYGIEPYCS